jgi:hypothetical protein
MEKLSEKEYIALFLKQLTLFEQIMLVQDIRLYCLEFPVRTIDGEKFEDVILESAPPGHIVTNNHNNTLYCLEFKKDKVDYHSAVAQNIRIVETIRKQLYRKEAIPIIVAPEYAESEIKLAKDTNTTLIQFIPSNNPLMRIV